MFDCRSEKPLVRAFICGSRACNSFGIGINSPRAGRLYLSKAISAGLPFFSRTTCLPKSEVSEPLSQTAITTGLPAARAGSVMSRAAQMSGLLTLFALSQAL
jgi:hypothetical protein